MNEASFKYKAYTQLLEGKITDQEYQSLINEVGAFKELGSAFKSLWSAGKKGFAGGLKRAFNDEHFNDLSNKISVEIKKSVDQLKGYAKKLEIPDNQLNFILSKILLSSAGVNAADVQSASQNQVPQAASNGGSTKPEPGNLPTSELPAGTTVNPKNESQFAQALLQMLASATNKSTEDVAAAANEKKKDMGALAGTFYRVIAQQTGVDANKVSKIVKALAEKGHLVTENLEKQETLEESSEFGRWQRLAGFYLTEAPKPADNSLNYILKRVESGEIKNILDVPKIIKTAKIRKLTDDQVDAVIDALRAKKVVQPEQAEKAAEELKDEMDNVPESPAAGDAPAGASPAEQKDAVRIFGKYYRAATDIRNDSDIDNDKTITDQDIAEVIDALEKLNAIKIK